MSAQYKNINNTKLDKSIVYKYKFWQRQSLFGTSTFSEDIWLAASQSCRENRCFSVRMYTCTEWRNSTRWLSSAVLCHAALLLRTQVVARRWMQCFCMFIRCDSCPESTCFSSRSPSVRPPDWVSPLTLSSSMSLHHSLRVNLKSETHYIIT